MLQVSLRLASSTTMSLYTVLDIASDAGTFELEQAFRTRSLQFIQKLDSRDHREFYAVSDAFQSEYDEKRVTKCQLGH